MSDKLVEAVVGILLGAGCEVDEDFGIVSIDDPDTLAREVIAVVIERCAKVADAAEKIQQNEKAWIACTFIAAAIRKLGESE